MPGSRGLAAGSEEVCAVAVASDAAADYCAANQLNLEALVADVVGRRARRFTPGERPTQIILRNEPLPRTSTRKVRRPDVHEWIREEVH